MTRNPSTRGTPVLVVAASVLMVVFAGLGTTSNTNSAKPFTIEAYEEGWSGREILRDLAAVALQPDRSVFD